MEPATSVPPIRVSSGSKTFWDGFKEWTGFIGSVFSIITPIAGYFGYKRLTRIQRQEGSRLTADQIVAGTEIRAILIKQPQGMTRSDLVNNMIGNCPTLQQLEAESSVEHFRRLGVIYIKKDRLLLREEQGIPLIDRILER